MANGGVGGQKKGSQSEDLTQDSWQDLASCIFMTCSHQLAPIAMAKLKKRENQVCLFFVCCKQPQPILTVNSCY